MPTSGHKNSDLYSSTYMNGSSGATDNGSYYGSEDEVQIVSIKYLKMLLIVF
jgi:hypothetical protein